MIVCNLINKGGASEFKTFECAVLPRRGDIIVKRSDPNEWGNALKVLLVVHKEGKPPELHVEFHGSERYL